MASDLTKLIPSGTNALPSVVGVVPFVIRRQHSLRAMAGNSLAISKLLEVGSDGCIEIRGFRYLLP